VVKVSRQTPILSRREPREETAGAGGDIDSEQLSPGRPSALEENVDVIKRWESAVLLARSRAEQISDWIAGAAGKGPVLFLHVLWFASWVTVNLGAIRGIRPFDPFPFPFLTMTVSLETIFMTMFVLASQNRLARQADKRSHLDLQIDLLAEQEMTAVLQLLQDIARHLHVRTSLTPEQLRDLIKKTDVWHLTNKIEDLAEPPADAGSTATPASTPSSGAAVSGV
jgi:uncharacterized membrane protein